jgi:hypothetical protein
MSHVYHFSIPSITNKMSYFSLIIYIYREMSVEIISHIYIYIYIYINRNLNIFKHKV